MSLSDPGAGEHVTFRSLGVDINGLFIHAVGRAVAPVLIVSHGAGDRKEDYVELANYLAERGISSLLLDMHGHGTSGGRPYHVTMREWVADIVAAIDYLETRNDVKHDGIGAFGISSGGTAILEAAVVDSRLKALIPLDATVMNTLPLFTSLTMRVLSGVGYIKRLLTGEDLRISVISMLDEVALASDPEINNRLKVDPGKLRALASLPLPGAAQAFFVNTIKRVPQIKAATLVVWGEDDELDPVSTAHALHRALTCTKGIEIIPGNGHAGHLDRNRLQLFEVCAQWLLKHLA
ncbi:MAG TPA: alpha/beta fold hydrolase [Prosthecobacter sp.]|nr:alpha/beta fold hydrolase [Prosthecobacter sp.]